MVSAELLVMSSVESCLGVTSPPALSLANASFTSTIWELSSAAAAGSLIRVRGRARIRVRDEVRARVRARARSACCAPLQHFNQRRRRSEERGGGLVRGRARARSG